MLVILGSSPAQRNFLNNFFQILIMSEDALENIIEMPLVYRSEIAKV
jgi:hypothetical protein